VARLCESQSLSSNTASAIQNPEAMLIWKPLHQKLIEYLPLMVNRPVPVLKDQMVVSGKRFIESENGAIQNASICAARELIDLFIILSPLIVRETLHKSAMRMFID
jgi:hypothetical protein